MRERRVSVWLLSLVVTSGCIGALERGGFVTPRASRSEFFASSDAGIFIEPGAKHTRFVLVLSVVLPPPAGAIVLAEFEDPCGGRPVAADPQEFSGQASLSFRSPSIGCLRNVTAYEAVVRVYSDRTRSALLSTHTQLIRSNVDSRWLQR
jgi:hypothetical protein